MKKKCCKSHKKLPDEIRRRCCEQPPIAGLICRNARGGSVTCCGCRKPGLVERALLALYPDRSEENVDYCGLWRSRTPQEDLRRSALAAGPVQHHSPPGSGQNSVEKTCGDGEAFGWRQTSLRTELSREDLWWRWSIRLPVDNADELLD